MPQTQLASMYIGNRRHRESVIVDGASISTIRNIFILDGQYNTVHAHINERYVISNVHDQDKETNIEQFRMTVIGSEPYAEFLGKRNRLIIPGEDGELREFRIFEVDKYRDGEGLKVDVYARATYLDLITSNVIDPFKTNAQTSEWHVNNALVGTGWQAGNIDYRGTKSIEFDNHTNPYNYLRRIAREFELELYFYVTTDGNEVTGRYVDLVEQVGEWRGRVVEFGRDLKGIKRKEDTTNVVTALVGLGPIDDDGNRLEVFVEDIDALERWGENGTKHIVEVYEPQSDRIDMTEEELIQYTRTELNKRINAVVSYETEIVDLEHVPGLEHKKIRFGDTIRIKDLYFEPPLYLEARIFKQRRDIFNNSTKEVELGDYTEYTQEEIMSFWQTIRDEITRRMDRLALVTILGSNVFKNGVGQTDLIAETFVNGKERDEDGTYYHYQWIKFDKDGNQTYFYAEGKTITVHASDIDVKATYRVDVSLGADVVNSADITITNLFDGEKGEPGDKGDKGDPGADGRSVDDIITQYYKSTSDTDQIGGSWLDDRPDYDKGYFLWTRSKITYSNPTGTDYTTPVLDDSWQAIDIADDAVLTADGKNSVFRQATEPSVVGRKIGDIWFNKSEGNRMYTFDGVSWQASEWGEQAIAAQSITALNIKSLAGLNVNDQFMVDENGNVTFGGEMIGGRIIGSEFRTSFDGYGVMVINPEGIKMGEAFDYNAKGLILDFNSLEFGRFYDDDFIRTAKYSENIIEAVDELVVKSPKIRFDGGYVIEFAGGPSIDTTDGRARLRANNSSYAVVDPDGRFSTWGPGALRTFSVDASGTVTTASDNRDYYALHLQPNGNLRIFNSNVNDYVFELDADDGTIYSTPTYNNTSSNSANVRIGIDSEGRNRFLRTSSAKKYKHDIRLSDIDPYKIRKLKVHSWVDKGEFERNGNNANGLRRYYGLIADDVAEVLPEFGDYNHKGEVENYNDRLFTLLIPIVNDILERLDRNEIH